MVQLATFVDASPPFLDRKAVSVVQFCFLTVYLLSGNAQK